MCEQCEVLTEERKKELFDLGVKIARDMHNRVNAHLALETLTGKGIPVVLVITNLIGHFMTDLYVQEFAHAGDTPEVRAAVKELLIGLIDPCADDAARKLQSVRDGSIFKKMLESIKEQVEESKNPVTENPNLMNIPEEHIIKD